MSATEATPNDALNPHGSAWVGANAGAGKTYILVSRLVRLMLDGVAPEKLLCLTYTRAAAAEMQSRLFDLLAEWALLDDAALQAAIAKGWAARPMKKPCTRRGFYSPVRLKHPAVCGCRPFTVFARACSNGSRWRPACRRIST